MKIVISEGRNMNLARNIRFILLVATSSMSAAGGTYAQTCAPPSGFIDIPHPTVAAAEQLVAHTEEITVDRPLPEVLSAGSKTTPNAAIHTHLSLPHLAA